MAEEEVTYATVKFNNQVITPVNNQPSSTGKNEVTKQEDAVVNEKNHREFRRLLITFTITVIILLAVIIVLSILNMQKSKLLTEYKNLTEHHEDLTQQVQKLQDKNNKLTTECIRNSSECVKTSIINGQHFGSFPLCGKIFENSYYFFSSSQLSWNESQQWCKAWDSDLVVINTPEKQQFLKNNTKNGDFWIGLTDAAEEGKWKWVDGTDCDHRNKDTTYFFDSEPDNYLSHGMDEDCAIMRSRDGKWGDVKCTNSYHWICEKRTDTCHS